jgi:hypothetical protein
MAKFERLEIPAWMLPVLVAVLVIPAFAGFALGGPPAGIAAGAVTVAALLIVAGRLRYDTPIEVAPAPDGRYRVLIVSAQPIDAPELVEQIAAITSEGATAVGADPPPELLVLAPATSSRIDRWADDLEAARRSAHEVLGVSLGAFAAAGLDAAGRVGDGSPIQAVEDTLHSFAANEVVVIRGGSIGASEVGELRRRLDRPIRELGSAQKPNRPVG